MVLPVAVGEPDMIVNWVDGVRVMVDSYELYDTAVPVR